MNPDKSPSRDATIKKRTQLPFHKPRHHPAALPLPRQECFEMAGHDAIEYALFRSTRPIFASGFARDSAPAAPYEIARLNTSVPLDNCWRRCLLPRLQTVGLQWVNFQVMSRTHSCLLDEIGIDPQVRADQMGHSVDVNQNQYTRSSLNRWVNAVNALQEAVGL